ncbi:MAG: PQQ-dependent dehydrogenase, methanol/ethanol family [Novosphingobium sp.]
MRRVHLLIAVFLAIAAAFGGLMAVRANSAEADALAAANWTSHNGGAQEAAYSTLGDIDRGNVGRLGLAWQMELPGEATLEATPLAVDGVLYFTGSMAAVYAVDAVSGKLLWKYDPEVWKVAPQRLNMTVFPVNRGAAYAGGRLFVATLDGRLIALDAKTGTRLWSVTTVPPDSYHTITGVPRTFAGKVIIGQGGADIGARGFVTAYDQVTGRQLWRFYTTPGSPDENKGDAAMERAAATWSGEYWKRGTGGTVWNGITFDPELNRIYIGTGNGGPYDPEVRSPGKGDNLYLCSIVALDADTGKYVWHYQINPREGWDYKATADMVAATLTIDGRPRKVLMQAPTNGFFYVLDRETGKLISAEKYGKVTWADRIDLVTGRPVERPGIRYEAGDVLMYPGSIGAHNWQAMAFSPETGLVYIPYMQIGTQFAKGRKVEGGIDVGGVNMAWSDHTDPDDGKGALVAWDPVAQKQRWRVPLVTIWNGGTMATAGGLVFQGTADGYLSAYDAANGQRLWRYYVGMGIVAAPMTYRVGGKQYVSILAGYGSAAAAISHVANIGWKFGVHPRRILTFVLDGKARLPETPPPNPQIEPLDDPDLVLSAADVAQGEELYHRCLGCHGREAIGAGGAPDLRESPIALGKDSFLAVVHDGVLLERGMPSFAMLPPEQLLKIHAYIRSRARAELRAQQGRATSTPTKE